MRIGPYGGQVDRRCRVNHCAEAASWATVPGQEETKELQTPTRCVHTGEASPAFMDLYSGNRAQLTVLWACMITHVPSTIKGTGGSMLGALGLTGKLEKKQLQGEPLGMQRTYSS